MGNGLTLLMLSDGSGTSTGIDPEIFRWVVGGLALAVSTMAGMLYKGERDRRIKCEDKLEKFQEIAPDLADNVQWLVDQAESELNPQQLPWPYQRPAPRRSSRPTARRRSR